MKQTRSEHKTGIVLAILLSAGMANLAYAEPDESAVKTFTADVIVAKPSQASLTLTAAKGLEAGEALPVTTLVTGKVSVNSGSAVLRWTPGLPEQVIKTNGKQATLTTENGNTLCAKIDSAAGTPISFYDGWIHSFSESRDFSFIINTDCIQDVKADTYRLSLDAARWER